MTRFRAAVLEQTWGSVEGLVSMFPGVLGQRLRYCYWKRRLRSLGKDVRFGIGVRIYSPQCVQIGDHCWIDDYVVIIGGPLRADIGHVYRPQVSHSATEGEVAIGERVHLAPFVLIQGHGGVRIGSCLTIASGAKIYSLSHHYRDLTEEGDTGTVYKFVGSVPPSEQALICAPVVIEDNAAVGLNSVVLPGSHIGRDSWLGAMSLLRGELPPGVIASGIPASVTRQRFE